MDQSGWQSTVLSAVVIACLGILAFVSLIYLTAEPDLRGWASEMIIRLVVYGVGLIIFIISAFAGVMLIGTMWGILTLILPGKQPGEELSNTVYARFRESLRRRGQRPIAPPKPPRRSQ